MAKSKKRCFYNIQSGVFVVKYSILRKSQTFPDIVHNNYRKGALFENEHQKIIGKYYKFSERK